MEGPGKHQVIISIKLVEALSKGSVVDQTSSLIDHNQS
jgi:hypothetical protein